MRYSENFQGLFSCQTQVLIRAHSHQSSRKLTEKPELHSGARNEKGLSLTPKSLGP